MEQALTTFDQPSAATMSSREIASATGKEHRNVTRDIRAMFEELEINALKFEHIYQDTMNRDQVEYHLDHDLTLTLATGYSAKLRFALVKRWRELEHREHAARLEQLESQIEHHKALAIEARDQFLERATQAEQLYRELHDKRSVEVPTSAGRFNILDVFQDHRVEQGKDGALLIHGYVTGVEQEVTVRCHRGRWFMDQLVLCEVFGLSPLQTKKLTTQADRCVVDGRLLLDLRCMPKPLTNLVM